MSEAKTKISIDVGEGAKSLRQLKEEFKQGEKELEGLIDGTKEYTDQLKKLGSVKSEIENLNTSINNSRPDKKLAAFTGAARSIAAGFEAATAASALFGAEQENVEKALLKVQSAMALANAVQEFDELGEKVKQFGTQLKAAIGSSGIGALLLVLGAVVAYWDQIKTAVTGVSSEMENELAISKEVVKAEQEKLSHINGQENILKLQGKSEIDILKLKKEQAYQVIQAQLRQLESQITIQKVQEETSRRNRDILKGILTFIEAPINLMLASVDLLGKAIGEDWNLVDKFTTSVSELIFDPEKVKEEGSKQTEELIKQLQNEANAIAGFQLQIEQIKKSNAEKAKADADKEAEERWKRLQEEFKREKEQVAAEQAALDELKAIDKQKSDAEASEKDRIAAEEAFKLNASALAYEASEKEKTKTTEEEAAKRKALREAELSVATSVISSMGSLAQILGQQGEAMSQFQKGLAVTQIAIDTAKAISGAVAQAQTVPFPGNLVAIATGVATVLANIARAKQILQSAGGGSGPNLPSLGGGSSGSVRPPQINSPSNTSTVLSDINSNNKQSGPVKAYVVETEMTSSQKHIQRIEKKTKY